MNIQDPPYDFEPAFQAAGTTDMSRTVELGELNLPTGRIMACDALAPNGAEVLKETVSPGNYKVTALVVKTGEETDRYALVKLTVNQNPVVRWQLAIAGDQTYDDLAEGEIFGYAVSSGLGSLCDAQAFEKFVQFDDKLFQEHPEENIYDDYLEERFKANAENPDDPKDHGDWLNLKIPPDEKDNIIMFQSGWGDGFYPSYWGYDADDNICALVTDFGVIQIED